MKNILLTLLCLFLVSGCTQGKPVKKDEQKLVPQFVNPPAITERIFDGPVFKGIELSSWNPANGEWHFSLLPGKNWRPPVSVITDPKTQIIGIKNLKEELAKLPEGENVFWLNYAKKPVPSDILDNLIDYSKQIKIKLKKL